MEIVFLISELVKFGNVIKREFLDILDKMQYNNKYIIYVIYLIPCKCHIDVLAGNEWLFM